ncbi:alpha/beta fold hydrolase [Pseudomonas profundi]|uniref:alpha/beta fold hydrolase n=1 Tax=Pseudomonas profundi TaxID=1981513 RepID=UPI0012397831|nr:alpha/beta hydrolase [Pseudomonas profundi]
MSSLLYGAHVQANGIRQHYLRYGGSGEPLVILPGITSPAVTWGFVGEVLSQHFDVYILDVRGRGLSSSGPDLAYDTTACADDVIAFAECLGLERFHLMGHSMGARFALRANTRGLAARLGSVLLIDPPVSGPGRRAYPSQLPWYVDSIRLAQRGMSGEDMKAFCPTWSDEQLQLRAQWLHTCYEPAIIRAFNDFHSVDIHPDFVTLRARTLLMTAGRGDVINADDIAEIRVMKPSIEVVTLADAGHMIPWDNLGGFIAAVGDFLGVAIRIQQQDPQS